jgi:hypothetical protein
MLLFAPEAPKLKKEDKEPPKDPLPPSKISERARLNEVVRNFAQATKSRIIVGRCADMTDAAVRNLSELFDLQDMDSLPNIRMMSRNPAATSRNNAVLKFKPADVEGSGREESDDNMILTRIGMDSKT